MQADSGAHGVRVDGCAQRRRTAGQGGFVGPIDGGLARRRVPGCVLRSKLPHKSVARLRAGLRRGCHGCPRSACQGLLSAARPVRGWLLNRVLRPDSMETGAVWALLPSSIRDLISCLTCDTAAAALQAAGDVDRPLDAVLEG